VIGVILSGGLDDGVEGLSFIKANGGIAVVQDPEDAAFPGMPSAAIEKVEVDHVAEVTRIPALLSEICRQEIDPQEVKMVRQRSRREGADPAETGDKALQRQSMPGPPSAMTCPECGGALWELVEGELLRYRCHVGHSYTSQGLVANQNGALESALWTAVRALEEQAELRRRMARRAARGDLQGIVKRYNRQAADAEGHASVIRQVLLSMRDGEDTENATAAVSRLPLRGKRGKPRKGIGTNGQPGARRSKKARARSKRKTAAKS
jgi:two-component system chemotaxis response regulator CheB